MPVTVTCPDDHAVKPLVLVVDDEPDVRNLLDKFLSKRGLRLGA